MTPPLTFRRGALDDAEALANLAARTFLETSRDFEEVQDNADYVAKHFQVPAVARPYQARISPATPSSGQDQRPPA